MQRPPLLSLLACLIAAVLGSCAAPGIHTEAPQNKIQREIRDLILTFEHGLAACDIHAVTETMAEEALISHPDDYCEMLNKDAFLFQVFYKKELWAPQAITARLEEFPKITVRSGTASGSYTVIHSRGDAQKTRTAREITLVERNGRWLILRLESRPAGLDRKDRDCVDSREGLLL